MCNLLKKEYGHLDREQIFNEVETTTQRVQSERDYANAVRELNVLMRGDDASALLLKLKDIEK